MRPAVWIALAFAAGIAGGSRAPSPAAAPAVLALAFASAAWAFHRRRAASGIALALAAFCAGAGIAVERRERLRVDPPPRPVRATLRVASWPSRDSSGSLRFVGRCEGVSDPAFARLRGQAFSVRWSTSAALSWRDRVEVEGRVLPARRPANPGGWDESAYFRAQGIAARFDADALAPARLPDSPRWSAGRALGRLRSFWLVQIDAHLRPASGAVARAVLLADTSALDARTRDLFAQSGAAHLLAISGGNIVFLCALWMGALRALRVPRAAAAAGSLPFLAAYGALTGLGTSVFRATLMLMLVLCAGFLRREADLSTALAWAGIAMLAWNPFQLFDPAFQLSFLSVAAIAAFTPETEAPGDGPQARWRSWLAASLRLSFSTWAATAPCVAFHFFLFNPGGVLANLLLVPYFSAVLAAGAAFLSLAWIHPRCAETLGASAGFLIDGFTGLSRFFASLPGAWMIVSRPGTPALAAAYGCILLAALARHGRLGVWRAGILSLIACNFWIWAHALAGRNPELRISFLDVGHGDCAVLEFPGGGALLVDAGPGPPSDAGRYAAVPFLAARGIARLDGVLLTHPDADHAGGAGFILSRVPTAAVFHNGEPKLREIPRSLALRRGDRIAAGRGVEIDILHPPDSFWADPRIRENDRSVVLRVRHGTTCVLLAGDIEERAMEDLLAAESGPRCELLKAPHHGSDEGEIGARWIAAVSPRHAVISEAEKNRYGLPRAATIEALKAAGAQVRQTGTEGALTWVSDGRAFHLEE